MSVLFYLFVQLLSYGFGTWVIFVTTACTLAYLFRVPGIIVGHVIIAIAVLVLDLRWIQAEVDKPGWDGQPDQDFVFMVGVLIRIVLMNSVLVPVSILGLRLRRSR